MYSPVTSDPSSVAPRSSYTTADSRSSSDIHSSQRTHRDFSSSHRTSFLDMSPSQRATSSPGPAAYYAPNVYLPGISSPPGSPNSISPCQKIGQSETESYTLSSDQLSRIVTGIRQLPIPSRNSHIGSESVETTSKERLSRYDAQFTPAIGVVKRDMFPSIRATVLAAVIDHTLEGDELHKLDSDMARRKGRIAFDRYGREFDGQGTTTEDYPTLQSLIDPLTTYFRVLIASCSSITDLQELAGASHQYVSQLVTFADKYEWAAVLAYHFDFYRARVREMKRGYYSGWAHVDGGLYTRHLTGRTKGYATAPGRNPGMGNPDGVSSSDDERHIRKEDLCDLFNPGICASPCRYRRIHQCQGCGSFEHPICACPSSRVVVYSTKGPAQA